MRVRSDVIHMSRARYEERNLRNLSPRQEANLGSFLRQLDALTTELQWTCGELDDIQGVPTSSRDMFITSLHRE